MSSDDQNQPQRVTRREALAHIALGAAMLTAAPSLAFAQTKTKAAPKRSLEELVAREKELSQKLTDAEAELAERTKALEGSKAECAAGKEKAKARKVPACRARTRLQEKRTKAKSSVDRRRKQERTMKARIKTRSQESASKKTVR